MGDPRQTFYLPVTDEPQLRFTNTAMAMAERSTGKTVPELYAHFAAGMFGFDLLNRVIRAGLEGARLKNRTGGKEWKLADVESLIEDAVDDGQTTFDAVAEVTVEAFNAALARWFPDEDEGDVQDPPTAAGDGTTSFEPPSEPD